MKILYALPAVLGALLAASPLQAHQHSQETPNPALSTPEKTIHTFVDAVNAANIRQLWSCVSGATYRPEYDQLGQTLQQWQNENKLKKLLSISDLHSSPHGNTATVTLSLNVADPDLEKKLQGMTRLETGPQPSESRYRKRRACQDQTTQIESVPLRRERHNWKIVPYPKSEQQVRIISVSIVRLLATRLVIGAQELFKARERAEEIVCKSNLKQVGLYILLFTQDHDEKFALKAASYEHNLLAYKSFGGTACDSLPLSGRQKWESKLWIQQQP